MDHLLINDSSILSNTEETIAALVESMDKSEFDEEVRSKQNPILLMLKSYSLMRQPASIDIRNGILIGQRQNLAVATSPVFSGLLFTIESVPPPTCARILFRRSVLFVTRPHRSHQLRFYRAIS